MLTDEKINEITTLSPAYVTIRAASEYMKDDILEGENLRGWGFILRAARENGEHI